MNRLRRLHDFDAMLWAVIYEAEQLGLDHVLVALQDADDELQVMIEEADNED